MNLTQLDDKLKRIGHQDDKLKRIGHRNRRDAEDAEVARRVELATYLLLVDASSGMNFIGAPVILVTVTG